jgi:polysaccharide biosynthesis transport protein
MAHLRWILVITLAVVGAAAAYAHRQTPMYKSEADVNVWFSSPDPVALQGPNMVTEKGIASSGAVLAIAAHKLGVPQSVLLKGLVIKVPASSSIMGIGYSDPVPWIAQQRARAIAAAYVAYRSPKLATPKHTTSTASQPGTTLRATVITRAALPTSPSSPNEQVDIVVALIVGLGLAIGSAAILDHLDDRFRGPLDLEAQTGTRVLALIPAFRTVSRDPASELALVWSPDSVVAEAYRNLRTRVVAAASARGARTLLVTSPAWEKKSAVAANLAVALAQSGRRTVLVCADLRWGWSHELLGVGNDAGLTMLLDRRTDLAAALRTTSIHALRVLPPGPVPADPAACLQQPALRTVLGELRSHADFVVIDAPPLLASPDTTPLAHLAEMILVVGDARKTTRALWQATMREAGEAVGKLVGSVLYNVGRRRWLRGSRTQVAHTFGPPDLDVWSRHDTVDGHEAPPSRLPATNITLTSGPA